MIRNKNKYRLLGLECSRKKIVHLWKRFALDTFWYLPNTGYVPQIFPDPPDSTRKVDTVTL